MFVGVQYYIYIYKEIETETDRQVLSAYTSILVKRDRILRCWAYAVTAASGGLYKNRTNDFQNISGTKKTPTLLYSFRVGISLETVRSIMSHAIGAVFILHIPACFSPSLPSSSYESLSLSLSLFRSWLPFLNIHYSIYTNTYIPSIRI